MRLRLYALPRLYCADRNYSSVFLSLGTNIRTHCLSERLQHSSKKGIQSIQIHILNKCAPHPHPLSLTYATGVRIWPTVHPESQKPSSIHGCNTVRQESRSETTSQSSFLDRSSHRLLSQFPIPFQKCRQPFVNRIHVFS